MYTDFLKRKMLMDHKFFLSKGAKEYINEFLLELFNKSKSLKKQQRSFARLKLTKGTLQKAMKEMKNE